MSDPGRLVICVRGEILAFEEVFAGRPVVKLEQHIVPAGDRVFMGSAPTGATILDTIEDMGETIRYSRWRLP